MVLGELIYANNPYLHIPPASYLHFQSVSTTEWYKYPFYPLYRKLLSDYIQTMYSQGNFNKDSVHKILRQNHIYDYQFDIVDNTTTQKKKGVSNKALSPKRQKLINN